MQISSPVNLVPLYFLNPAIIYAPIFHSAPLCGSTSTGFLPSHQNILLDFVGEAIMKENIYVISLLKVVAATVDTEFSLSYIL